MTKFQRILNGILTVVFILGINAAAVHADEATLDQLFGELQAPELEDWEAVEKRIWDEWSKSGSESMDLLLERGREAISEGDHQAAIEHLTALTDHAPDFAEGWNARATAYFHAGLLGPSIEDIGRALALNPRHFGAMSGLGTILTQLGYEEDALEIYRQAIAVHPHRTDLKDAIETLEKVVEGTNL